MIHMIQTYVSDNSRALMICTYDMKLFVYDTIRIVRYAYDTKFFVHNTIRITYRMILITMLTTKKLYIKGDILKTQNMSFTQLPKEQINGD